ncbi:hypothetical protein [Dyella sp.]|uniref:hypothetical protein n=1 Tax=Dyella sp. TaxID=1869338 RepID=UPI002D7887A0|nr:hypothetical protein [Dyella sp.]HET7329896.1 hypothetical protein [Dyella sp.]
MSVWEITNRLTNDVAMLVMTAEDRQDPKSGKEFDVNGVPMRWRRRPALDLYIARGRKKPKPRADLSPFRPGALVLNAKARDALGDFLGQFGQLLELDVAGQVEYFYNVTNIQPCIDRDRSEKRPEGSIAKEMFSESAVPSTPAVFKDPLTARTSIYVNDGAKAILEQRIAEFGITGMDFARRGE